MTTKTEMKNNNTKQENGSKIKILHIHLNMTLDLRFNLTFHKNI